jgi:hypothetical protein
VAPRSALTASKVRACTRLWCMYAFTARRRACRIGGLRFCQFAACYEAHLPSVTVRDENAAGPNALSTLRKLHSPQTNGVAGVG